MRDLLLLTPLARFADAGLLLLRWVTGAFLIYQSHDNVISGARMQEFVGFCRQFGIPYPEIAAPLSVYWQIAAGIGFVLGLLTRWLGLVTMFNFIVACWYVHWSQNFTGWWPALVLVFLGLYFGLRGAGRYSLDAVIARRDGM
jgi:putative oxidoreductase